MSLWCTVFGFVAVGIVITGILDVVPVEYEADTWVSFGAILSLSIGLVFAIAGRVLDVNKRVAFWGIVCAVIGIVLFIVLSA
jgi:hypothetical protein